MIKHMSKLVSASCLTAALLVASAPLFAQAPTKPARPAARQAPAVRDLEIIDQDGYKALLEKYRGKALLVNFWATWCEPCREEYPMLNQLARQYAPQGLHLVGISLDDDGEMILVRRFLAKHQPIFPNYRKRPGKEEEFINAVNPRWSGAIPASFFYAADGRQIGHFVGEASREKYEAAIRMLLEKSKSSSPDSR
jgi:thiol-disulfide isomerase/thioredoxin